jgi:TPR repeat protein
VLSKEKSSDKAAEASYYLGWLHEYGKGVETDLKTAYRLYRKAAEKGYAKGFTKCGDFIYDGTHYGHRDKTLAFNQYKQGAEFGDPEACN